MSVSWGIGIGIVGCLVGMIVAGGDDGMVGAYAGCVPVYQDGVYGGGGMLTKENGKCLYKCVIFS